MAVAGGVAGRSTRLFTRRPSSCGWCASRRLSPTHTPLSLCPPSSPSSPMASTDDETQKQLTDATRGFDELFQNELENARKIFSSSDSPFHQLGLGACAFLEAALGMEVSLRSIST